MKELIKQYSSASFIEDRMSKYKNVLTNTENILVSMNNGAEIIDHKLFSIKSEGNFRMLNKLYFYITPFFNHTLCTLSAGSSDVFYYLPTPTTLLVKPHEQKILDIIEKEYNSESKIMKHVTPLHTTVNIQDEELLQRNFTNAYQELLSTREEDLRVRFSSFKRIVITNSLTPDSIINRLIRVGDICVIRTGVNSSTLNTMYSIYESGFTTNLLFNVMPYVGNTQSLLDSIGKYFNGQELYLVLNNTGFNIDNIFASRQNLSKLVIIEGRKNASKYQLIVNKYTSADKIFYLKPLKTNYIKYNGVCSEFNYINDNVFSKAMLLNMVNIMLDEGCSVLQTFDRYVTKLYSKCLV